MLFAQLFRLLVGQGKDTYRDKDLSWQRQKGCGWTERPPKMDGQLVLCLRNLRAGFCKSPPGGSAGTKQVVRPFSGLFFHFHWLISKVILQPGAYHFRQPKLKDRANEYMALLHSSPQWNICEGSRWTSAYNVYDTMVTRGLKQHTIYNINCLLVNIC